MYVPAAFAVEDRAEILESLRSNGFGHLVTAGATAPDESVSGLTSTALPFVVDDDLAVLRAHFARANRHWKSIDGGPALLIVPIVDAYVSPRWYPTKQERGEVVPTWNYELIQIHGTIEVCDDRQSVLAIVRALTEHQEQRSIAPDRADGNQADRPWQVEDAPDDFIAKQLKAIVGVRLVIDRIEAKRKLSQNRSDSDRLGTVAGLGASPRPGDRATAARMEATGPVPT
ncbi:MAG: FMN-binding negative transcriptional regulator [Acidimicrobiales bacterium]